MVATPAGPTTAALPAPSIWKDITRFVTPYLLMLIVSLAAKFGFHVTLVTAAGILTIGGTALGIVVRILERWFPWFGVFLGYIGAPAYKPTAKKSLEAQLGELAAQYVALQAQITENAKPSPASAPAIVSSITAAPSPPAA